jgi:undecaprenyl diphosphate synthase
VITDSLSHIAIILDGNGRWATGRGLKRLAGHQEGARSVRQVITHCRESGLRYLSLYAFSTENWGRPRAEIDGLMRLLARFLTEEEATLKEHGIELVSIGDTTRLPHRVRTLLNRVGNTTRGARGMRLTLAISYSSHDEITRVVRRLARRSACGALNPETIDCNLIEGMLDTRDTPPVDLLIRTGGEQRLSNFLLWQAAYAELYVTHTPWPAFRPADLDRAVAWYHGRKRTFGLVEAVG